MKGKRLSLRSGDIPCCRVMAGGVPLVKTWALNMSVIPVVWVGGIFQAGLTGWKLQPSGCPVTFIKAGVRIPDDCAFGFVCTACMTQRKKLCYSALYHTTVNGVP